MTQRKVSVVVPVYNVEEHIRQCLESIMAQTLQDFEVVVVDDCTPDNSMRVVREFADHDDRFRIVTHEKNRGLMQARKSGYTVAEGEYVIFCDSDDFLPADAIEKLYNEAVRTAADVVSGDMVLYFPDTGREELWSAQLRYGSNMVAVYKSLLLSEYYHNLCGKIFKKRILCDYPYITLENFTNGEDGYLFYQIVENTKKVVHLEEPIYYYRQNMQSSTKCRYGHNAIRSICKLNQLRGQLADKHPEIRKYAYRKITVVLVSLYNSGYDKDAGLDEYVREFGLSKYVSLWSVFKHVPPKEACMILVRKFFLQ